MINKQLLIGLIMLLFSTNIVASQHRDSIKLGTEDWAPFSFIDKKTKRITGLSSDIIYATFRSMNVKISSNKVLPWARTQKLAYQGKFDAVYTASINNERKKYMLFPKEPVVSSKWVLFANIEDKKRLKFENFKSLKDKKICLISGYNYPRIFMQYIKKNSKLTFVSKENLNISKLINHRCDYMPAVLESTLNMIKTKPLLKRMNAYKKIFYFERELSISNFYLMFSKKNVSKEFVNEFSKKLKLFKTTQEYNSILNKYL